MSSDDEGAFLDFEMPSGKNAKVWERMFPEYINIQQK